MAPGNLLPQCEIQAMIDILKNTRSELSPRPGGMSFEEIFGLRKASKPTPISPTAAKWIKAFEDNVAAILRVRNAPRVEAERVAFINTVTAFLDANRPDTDRTNAPLRLVGEAERSSADGRRSSS